MIQYSRPPPPSRGRGGAPEPLPHSPLWCGVVLPPPTLAPRGERPSPLPPVVWCGAWWRSDKW